ncbi:hypothetical protein [Nostoc favosum]|uniref:Uncharacterized protein n=1 Tax=Nostoc favosum CHAB5714 TaxID=2780399 RepID=A0ABS8ILJ0_9NOSO|nr:hypothetical protein [Nostoc favosum]MCC5604342.1 hypothetical protein [Nostoc favosum CHAB5714]
MEKILFRSRLFSNTVQLAIFHFLSSLSVSRQLLLLSETLREQVGEPQGRTGFSAPLWFIKKNDFDKEC